MEALSSFAASWTLPLRDRDPKRAHRAQRWRAGGRRIEFRVGIHVGDVVGVGIAYGYATLGSTGFEGRSDHSAIGTVRRIWPLDFVRRQATEIFSSIAKCARRSRTPQNLSLPEIFPLIRGCIGMCPPSIPPYNYIVAASQVRQNVFGHPRNSCWSIRLPARPASGRPPRRGEPVSRPESCSSD